MTRQLRYTFNHTCLLHCKNYALFEPYINHITDCSKGHEFSKSAFGPSNFSISKTFPPYPYRMHSPDTQEENNNRRQVNLLLIGHLNFYLIPKRRSTILLIWNTSCYDRTTKGKLNRGVSTKKKVKKYAAFMLFFLPL